MRVCTECGWRFENDRSTCLICGGEVVPLDDLFLPPPQPLASYWARIRRWLRPLQRRFRAWIDEADVADRQGGGFTMWWQDVRYREPRTMAVAVLGIVLVFSFVALGPTLYNLLREWLRGAAPG